MSKHDKDQRKKPASPSQAELAKKERQKEEVQEVLGRHKNEGQKDHKGAR